MLLYKVNQATLEAIIEETSKEYAGNIKLKSIATHGKGLRFTITVKDSKNVGAKRGVSGRRISAACWHAHRDLMRNIFKANPDARLKTMLADYKGKQDFENKFQETGYVNVGSYFNPLEACNACECM